MTERFNVGFPFLIDGRGSVASPDEAEHIDQMIELALLTTPGERVNRPQFGVGLMTSLFEAFDQSQATLLELEIRAFLTEQFRDRFKLTQVSLGVNQSTVEITVGYVLPTQGARVSRYVYDLPR